MASIFYIQKNFNTKFKCYKHLEKQRWGKEPICPHCESKNVAKRLNRKFFYHCNECDKDFTVLYGTIFENSNLPLPKWFMLIAMMLNARKGISAMELSRQLQVTYKTAWYSAMRVRCAMIDEVPLLEGIVEMDEVYIGGKPRKRNKNGSPDNEANLSNITTKRGRGTKKVPVVGMVERGGKKRVVTEVANRLTTKSMMALLKKYVNEEKTIMMTDEARFYKGFDEAVQRLVIKHKESYADGIIHTNTIEGYWSIIKNGIRGEYHSLSKKYLPFYLAEFAYKYNRRDKNEKQQAFGETIENAVNDKPLMVNYKPKGDISTAKGSNKNGKAASSKQNNLLVKRIIAKVARQKRKKALERAKSIIAKIKKK